MNAKMVSLFGLAFFLMVRLIPAQDLKSETWNSIISISEDKAAELGSLYEALWANNSSWQSGDVLIRVSYFSDSTKLELPDNGDLVLEDQKNHRFRFDHEQGHFLYVYSYERVVPLVVFPDGSTTEIGKETRIRGFVINSQGAFIRDFPRKMRKATQHVNLERLFREFFVPELRATGFLNIGADPNLENLKAIVPRLSSGEGITNVTETDDNTVRWNRKTAVPGKDDLFFVEETVFDVKRLVPVSNRLSVDSLQDNKFRRGEQYREKWEWGEIQGIQVPTAIFNNCLTDHRIGEHRFVCEHSIEASVIWLELNSKLDQSKFDQAVLQEIDLMMKLVDVESVKKDSLLPLDTDLKPKQNTEKDPHHDSKKESNLRR